MATLLVALIALSLMADFTQKSTTNALQLKPSSLLKRGGKNDSNGKKSNKKKANYAELTSSRKFVLSSVSSAKDILVNDEISNSMMAMTVKALPEETVTLSLSGNESDESDDPVLAYLNKKNTAETVGIAISNQSQPSKRKKANVLWRHIPMQHLRLHPLYEQLPERVREVKSSKDLSLFRQGTVQWDVLHNGRLTTSKIQSCLGFYEARAAKMLKIPRSLSGHLKAVHARQLLLSKPVLPKEWDSLLAMYDDNDDDAGFGASGYECSGVMWTTAAVRGPSSFPYEYDPPLSLRSQLSAPHAVDSASSAKLMWGSYQEPVSILVAINYFRSLPGGGGIKLKECGMLPFESVGRGNWGLERESAEVLAGYIQDRSIPYIGASPDGLIEYADGSLSILEVKNHSPFTQNDNTARGVGVRQEEFVGDGSIGTWHMAQLQLEIFCAGVRCQNAVLVKSSIHSVSIYEVKRDNAYIMEMLYFLRKFYLKYVKPSKKSNRTCSIEENFFFDDARYRQFLEATNRKSREAVLMVKIDSKDVQRSPYNVDLLL